MAGKQEVEKLRTLAWDYHASNCFACLLAALFFARLTTEPSLSAIVVPCYLISIALFGSSLVLLIFLVLSKINRLKDCMNKAIGKLGDYVAGELGAVSVTIAFVELIYILPSNIPVDKYFIFGSVLLFLVLYYLLMMLNLKWDKQLLLWRLRLTGVMLIALAIVNLISIAIANQLSTFLIVSIVYLVVAVVCLLASFAMEPSKKTKSKRSTIHK